MLLRALIVDDEPLIVENLQNVIPWSAYQITVVGTADNGAAALELTQQLQPDLILCDIRMPRMDGLTFLEQLHCLGMDCSVIMLTGFQEFDYARRAVKFGAKDFVLKPINYEELKSVVTRVAEQIRERKQEHRQQEEKWKHYSHVVYEKLMNDVLMDYTKVFMQPLLPGDEAADDQPAYVLLLADLDRYAYLSRSWSENERKLYNFAVRNVLQVALLTFGLEYNVLQTREGEWCVLIRMTGDTVLREGSAAEWAQELIGAVAQNVKVTVSLAVCPELVPVSSLAGTYKKLQRELHFKSGSEQVLVLDGEVRADHFNPSVWALAEELVTGVKLYDRSRLERAYELLARELRAISEHSLTKANQILHFLILHILRELKEIQRVTEAEEDKVWSGLDHCLSAKDLMDTLEHLIEQGLADSGSRRSGKEVISMAEAYIRKHLGGELGIEEVADHLGLSSSHFSVLFKQHAGVTFLEHVTRLRIDWAKSLLAGSEHSITRVSNMVGYMDRRYFNKVFTRLESMSPAEYREKVSGLLAHRAAGQS
ncbi:response regulator [Paenibacillus filicis]|uniref:Response regulator n=1 Tax=Paenibacillus filicis TaxID=669464 RepID=A0ABU9DL56_9BACL